MTYTCSLNTCSLTEVLYFKCEKCQKLFCRKHITPSKHGCEKTKNEDDFLPHPNRIPNTYSTGVTSNYTREMVDKYKKEKMMQEKNEYSDSEEPSCFCIPRKKKKNKSNRNK